MTQDEDEALAEEAIYWNEEYEKCFGFRPVPPISKGVSMAHVHAVQSRVIRYYVEQMKEILEKHRET